jgi:hypothetical protein
MVLAQEKTLPKDSVLTSPMDGVQNPKDSLRAIDAARLDSMLRAADTLVTFLPASADSATLTATVKGSRKKKDWSTWRPNPTKALWMALVFPGGGQIYNRKYWNLLSSR